MPPPPQIFGKLFPDMEESKLLEMAELKESVYRELLAKEGLEALAGVHDMVDAVLAAGIRASCVTNAPRLNAEAVLTATKLRDKFEHLVIGDECERGKPFPDPYDTGMKLMDAKPENTIVFEVHQTTTIIIIIHHLVHSSGLRRALLIMLHLLMFAADVCCFP